jgi:hypothetical protein
MSTDESGTDMKVTEFREGLPTPEVSDAKAVLRFGLNERGRDFVVGDTSIPAIRSSSTCG